MSKRKTKLELTWIGKENRPRLEPRILVEDPEMSYHAARQFGLSRRLRQKYCASHSERSEESFNALTSNALKDPSLCSG